MVQGTLTTAGFDVVLAATIVALASVCIAQERTWLPPAPAEVQAFVRAALTDRFRANDIPDLKLLDATRPIGVRTVMPQARLTLIEQALPVVDGYEFFLISAADAQAAADREGKPVAFVTVDQPMPASEPATISIGAGMIVPAKSALISLCCCTGSAEFHRTGNRWAFIKWSGMICS